METFCEHYIPNNPDYFQRGFCCLHNKPCLYMGIYPEYCSQNAEKQKECKDYKEWEDPFETKEV